MAICLGKNFRSCSSFVLVGRRSQQTNCIDQKTSCAVAPLQKEMTACDYFPPVVSRNSRCPKLSNELQVSCSNAARLRSVNVSGRRLKHPAVERTINDGCLSLEGRGLFYAKECNAYMEDQKEPETEDNPGRPDRNQLYCISNILQDDLPKLFVKTMNYSIYHQNLVFENNIRGTKTRGLVSYVKEMSLLRIIGHLKFAHVKFDILKLTAHPEDGTVRVRWRISGISNYKAFFSFLKIMKSKKAYEPEGWYDGFSVFYVRSDGLIHKHTVDKMIPDSEEKIPNMRSELAAKMAFAVGILIKDFSISSVAFKEFFYKHPSLFNVLHLQKNLELFSKEKCITAMEQTNKSGEKYEEK